MQLTEEQREQYQEQLEDLDERQFWLEIMVQQQAQTHYLKQIRSALQGERNPNAKVHDPEDKYRCMQCSKVVSESERQNHLVDKHNAPVEMPVKHEFEAL